MKVHAETVLALPIAQAFEVISRMEDWFPLVDDAIESIVKTSEGPVGVGSTLDENLNALGRVMCFVITVESYEPPNVVGFTSDGPILFARGTIRCEERGDSTAMLMDMDVTPQSWGWLLYPVLFVTMQSTEQGRLDKLSQLVADGTLKPSAG